MTAMLRDVRICLLVGAAVVVSMLSLPAARAAARGCDTAPTGVVTADRWLSFRVPAGLMPDPQFDGRDARIRVHTVFPVYANGKCNGVPNQAMVLVHGGTSPGSTVFDLRLPPRAGGPPPETLSLQVALARKGIHTFALDLLGFGLSTRFADGLDDPCNASLPTDRTRHPVLLPLDLQGRYLGDGRTPVRDGLGVNPLRGVRCPHTSSTYFARVDVFVRDVRQVIDHAIDTVGPRGGKVVLLGYSFGGVVVGRTLYVMGSDADRKVRRAVFLSSVFNRPPGADADVNFATEEHQLSEFERSTSFPLALNSVGGWNGVGPRTDCTGRIVDGAPQALRDQTLALDPLGASWGGSDPDHPTGLVRSPTFSLYGWNPTVAGRLQVPALVLHGADDQTAPVRNGENIYDALTGDHKILVRIACGSHAPQLDAGPHATIAAALVEWTTRGTFAGHECGRFDVDVQGVASAPDTVGCAP